MPLGPIRRLFPTLRIRLVVWLTIVVLLLVVVTMVTVRQFYGRTLRSEFDQKLRTDMAVVKDHIFELHEQEKRLQAALSRMVLVHPFQQWFAAMYDDRGVLVWATDSVPPLPPFKPESVGSLANDGEFRFLNDVSDVQGAPRRYLRVGSSRATLEDDLLLLERSLILLSVFILALAPAGGFLLADQATRPIQWIISTAARLQPARLDERLPVRNSGDELDQLSVTINTLLDRIAQYISQQQVFIANAAHELRSPLASIRSSVEVGLNRARTEEEYVELLLMVVEECSRLSSLVNLLLVLAEGDAGQLNPGESTARLDKVVRETCEMFGPVAETKDVKLRSTHMPEVAVPGDEHRMRQVVRNLIDNAIKFNKPGGEVVVSLRINSFRKQAVLTVADTGVGISKSDQPNLFQRFFRGDRSRHRGGTGLGLSICESIVKASGGEIGCRSQPGQGSEFVVVLPLADPTRLPRDSSSAPEPYAKPNAAENPS